MKILMVLTSHEQLGNTGEKTGFWSEEFAAPYYTFLDAGAEITIASPKGGQPPIDPKSELAEFQTELTQRFDKDPETQERLANSVRLDQVNPDVFDAVFYPGGHGPLWDLADDIDSIRLIENYYQQKKPIGAVCHASAVLNKAKDSNNKPIVENKKVTGFSNTEEAAVGLTDIVPFLVEDEFVRLGAHYEKTQDWESYVVEDGLLVTGQNPASSVETAKALIQKLAHKSTK